MPCPLLTPGKDLVLIVQEAGLALGPVWTGAENIAPTGFRFPDRPARSQSLYRLRYPAHTVYSENHTKYRHISTVCELNSNVLRRVFPKSGKATINFVTSVCPTVRLSLCLSHCLSVSPSFCPHGTTRFLRERHSGNSYLFFENLSIKCNFH